MQKEREINANESRINEGQCFCRRMFRDVTWCTWNAQNTKGSCRCVKVLLMCCSACVDSIEYSEVC